MAAGSRWRLAGRRVQMRVEGGRPVPLAPRKPSRHNFIALYHVPSCLCRFRLAILIRKVAETFEFPLDGSDPAAALALDAAAAAMAAAGDKAPADGAAAAAGTAPVRRLADVARLDTCVTVVDASNLLDNLHSLQTLRVGGRRATGPRQGQSNVACGLLHASEQSDCVWA